MENDFRNLTAIVWANLDHPIKSYDFSKFCNFLHAALSDGTLQKICDVITVQISIGSTCTCMEPTQISKFFSFHESMYVHVHPP